MSQPQQPPFSTATVDKVKAHYAANPGQLLINGALVNAQAGGTIEAINPADEQVLGHIAAGTAADIDAAVNTAAEVFNGSWAEVPAMQRGELLNKLADLIERDAETLAVTESLDNGMPFMMARFGSVLGAVQQLRYNAGWATKIAGESLAPSVSNGQAVMSYTLREPVGVVGAIVAWNVPFAMTLGKIAPAIAAGCTVVLKPAEQASLSACHLMGLIIEAGFPPGVINIVTGTGTEAGAALVEHPLVDKISFTGSTLVGQSIVRTVADSMKRLTLELGGMSPVIVYDDIDVAKVAPSIAMGIFANSGQICAAGSRLFVHERIHDKLVEAICGFAKPLKVAPGLEPGAMLGPVVSRVQLERVLGYIDSGKAEGATLVTGGERVGDTGFFVQPTVFTHVKSEMKIAAEEIFGPVLCVMSFSDSDDIAQVAGLANATRYGLHASIWSKDVTRALRLSRAVKSGSVRINGGPPGVDPALPMGGMKASGWGRENGREGVEGYTELKTVSLGLQ